ncbi:MAG: PAS domain S-box protein [Microcoleaceae cyanobacterium]
MAVVNINLLATSFMPHGMCYLWKPGLVGLHLVSNVVIALSYLSIPIMLVQITRRRADVPFNSVFLLFAAFIVFCGVGHLFDIWTLWHPNYWASGMVRAITAIVSFATAITLAKLLPEISTLPSRSQVQEVNSQLTQEIVDREWVETKRQEEHEFLDALLENLSDGIVACDANGVLTLFNRATQIFHGLPQEPLPATEWAQHYDLYHVDGKTPLDQSEIPLFRALQGESVRDIEIIIAPKQGVSRTVLASGEPIRTVTGEKIGAVVAMRDITNIKQVQAQLEEREQFLRSIYNGVELAIFVVEVQPGPQFRYLGFNPACERLTGISVEEIYQKALTDLFPPEAAAQVHSNYAKCVEEVRSINYEEYLPFQGVESWWLTHLNPLRDPEGRVYRIIGTSLNITRRKHTEAQLQASIERYQLVADNSSDLISTQAMDGVYLYVSPACRQLLGYKPDELVGRNFVEFLHPEDSVALEQFQKSPGQLPTQYTQSYRFRRKDSSYTWLETTNKIVGTVEDESQVVISISRDITARKQAEVAVVSLNQQLERELNERKSKFNKVNRLYRAVINSIQEIIFQTDMQGRWTFLSPAWIEVTGFTFEDSLNTSFLDYVYSKRDQQNLNDLFQNLITLKQDSLTYEFRCPTRNGEFRWLEIYAQLNQDGEEVIGTFGALNDITERKQSEAVLKSRNSELTKQRKQLELQNLQLQEASKLKSQFLATMSHELRTPMNSIMGFSQMLQSQKYGELTERQHEMVERIFNNSQNLLEMLNEVLDFSRLESGRIELNPEEFDLEVLVRLTIEEMRSLADAKKLNLSIEIQNLSNKRIFNDKTCLRRSLINLVSNAIKFTEAGMVKVVASEISPDKVSVAVQDTGIGIANDDFETIFEAFRQVDQTLTRHHAGTGLGLAITKSLVEMMNGTIQVESTLGEGSTFTINLPRLINL